VKITIQADSRNSPPLSRSSGPRKPNFISSSPTRFVKAGQPGNAIPWYKEALRRRPESLAAALGLGDAFEKSGDEANALEAFRQATRISPAHGGN